MRNIDVFFYGLFMDESLLRSKGVADPNLRPATLTGYRLRIGNRATLIPMSGEIVYGLVASLSHDELERLYSEPGVQTYKPEAVLVHLPKGGGVPALCFNLPEPPSEEERNTEYAAKLRDLARQLNFPEEYVQSIR